MLYLLMGSIRLAQALRPKNRLPDATPIGSNAASDPKCSVARRYQLSVVLRLLYHGYPASCSAPVLLNQLPPTFLQLLPSHAYHNHGSASILHFVY